MLAGRTGLSPVMVGRAGALARLNALVPTPEAPAGRVAMVVGEAGIGKTRLVREVLAVHRDVVAIAGQADVGSLGRPFDVVASAIGTLPASDSPDRVRVAVDMVIERLGDSRAIVVFEDLHWCDAESASVFERLALAERPGLLLVGTYRPDELDRRLPGGDLLVRLERRSTVHHLHLDRLNRSSVAAMLAAINASPVPSRVTDELFQRTGGNPFFVEELVAGAGALNELCLDSRRPLPWTLAEVVRGQLDGLDPVARSVVDAAALLGRSATFDMLSTVTRLTEIDLLAQLRSLIARGLLVEERDECFVFRHALTRDAVESSLLGRERRRLHEAALAALQEAASPDLVALARHAAGAGRWDAMVELCRRGAREAMATGSTFQALRLASDALGEAPGDVELLALATRAAWMVGLHEEAYSTARRWLERASDVCGPIEESRATQQLVRVCWELGRDEERRRYLGEMERLAEMLAPGEEQARALAAVAQARMLESDPDAIAWAQRAVGAAEKAGARAVRAQALVELASALSEDPTRAIEARARFDEAIAESEAVGDLVSLSRALNNMIKVVPVYSPEGRQLSSRLREVAEVAGYDSMVHMRHAFRTAEIASFDGDHAEAMRALTMAAPALEGTHRAAAFTFRAQLLVEAGDPDTAATLLDDRTPLPAGDLDWRDRVALDLAAARGDRDQALVLLGGRLFAPRALVRGHHPALLVGAVDSALRAQVPPAELRARLGPLERSTPLDASAEGLAILGLLAMAEGDDDAAAAHLDVALASGLEDLSLPDRATLRIRAAQVAIRHRRVDAAAALARQAAVELARWPGWRSEELERLRQQLDPVVASPATDPSAGLLTSREVEVAALVAEGLTNAQLARRLNIAPKTAAAHVSNILAKLRVANRSEVAAWAARRGLGT